MDRRDFLRTTAGLALVSLVRLDAAEARAAEMEAAIRKVVGGAAVGAGRVTLELPPLSENGSTVPMTISVESPMTAADHVRAIHVFTELNPQPDVASFHLGPRSGRAWVSTRIRLAHTQNVTAIAELSDGSFWSGRAAVVVTLAACLEEA
jgi:sulfur-oxidizing protein SoxY